jgi:putative PIN family toxin of toxin-antitoxin system
MRLVLDTNVWLDWLVFDGREIGELRKAQRTGAVRFVIDRSCLEELTRVLAYPEFGLDASAIQTRLDEVGRLTEPHQGPGGSETALPRCKDPDDQKFLVLAAATKADCLVTRDNALLKLGRRTLRTCGFAIRQPAQVSVEAAD